MADTLSPQVLAICAQHFGRLGSGCGRCPIHAECSTPVQPLTRETLAAHRQRVNDAAEHCACFPGCCRGGEVIGGRLANGQRCRQQEQEAEHG